MIEIYNDGVRVAKTSKAFNVVVRKELMRAFDLDATIHNADPARKYITTTSMFKAEGQLFDICSFQQYSGDQNVTQIVGQHVGYRLNNYTIPPGYSTMGTIAEIAQAILDESGASAEFTVGTCADLGEKVYAITNEQETTARSAIFAMQGLGVEVDFDNFTLNFPERVGSDTGKVFKFGQDLCSLKRTWDKGNGITYDITIANLQRIPGHSGDTFEVGDDVTIEDYFIGDSIKRRIIAYSKCLDNPTRDTVTLGVFVRDIYDLTTEMKVDINTKLTEGESYNNVKINRTEGFVAESNDGQFKTTQGGEEGFACWVKEGGVWVKKSWLDASGLISNTISAPDSDIYARIGQYEALPFIFEGLQLLDRITEQLRVGLIARRGSNIISLSTGPTHADAFLLYRGDNRSFYVGHNDGPQLKMSDGWVEFRMAGEPYGITRDFLAGEKPIVKNGIVTGYY